MHRIEVRQKMGTDDVAAIQALLGAASKADDHAALDEHAWLDLVQGGREGFAGFVAWEEGHDHPVGYAQISRGPGVGVPQGSGAGVPDGAASWALELVVDPHHRLPGNTIGLDLVQEAAKAIAAEGGGHVHFWVNQARPEHDRIAASIGLARGRVLYQMRRALPVEGDLSAEAETLPTRPFRPGRDEEEWLEVNNRAFEWHPEQGGWDLATLKQREAEPWFDPDGFLLHENPFGHLDGFCWTKIHRETEPPMGEIYVIAVDPAAKDRLPHLGKRLVLAGLDYLSHRDLALAMLYVDATNAPAVKLYIGLGFVVNHLDQAYVGDIAPA